MTDVDLSPIHPGEVLLEDFLRPLNMSQYALARAIKVDKQRLNEIVRGRRAVTAETALRLARYFGTTPEFWHKLQARYDLERAADMVGDRIEREIVPRAAAE